MVFNSEASFFPPSWQVFFVQNWLKTQIGRPKIAVRSGLARPVRSCSLHHGCDPKQPGSKASLCHFLKRPVSSFSFFFFSSSSTPWRWCQALEGLATDTLSSCWCAGVFVFCTNQTHTTFCTKPKRTRMNSDDRWVGDWNVASGKDRRKEWTSSKNQTHQRSNTHSS